MKQLKCQMGSDYLTDCSTSDDGGLEDDDTAKRPSHSSNLPKECLEDIRCQETRRENLISELISSDLVYFRGIQALEKQYYEPLLELSATRQAILTAEQCTEIFSNISAIVEFHQTFTNLLASSPNVAEVCTKFLLSIKKFNRKEKYSLMFRSKKSRV